MGRFARVRDDRTREGEAPPTGPRRGAATAQEGFNLHTGLHVTGDDRDAVERLCRYVLRPAI